MTISHSLSTGLFVPVLNILPVWATLIHPKGATPPRPAPSLGIFNVSPCLYDTVVARVSLASSL